MEFVVICPQPQEERGNALNSHTKAAKKQQPQQENPYSFFFFFFLFSFTRRERHEALQRELHGRGIFRYRAVETGHSL
jgi:hypothetical protein